MLSKDCHETSKTAMAWADLCRTLWPGTTLLDPKFAEVKGYRWLFWKWNAKPCSPYHHCFPNVAEGEGVDDIALSYHVAYKGRSIMSAIVKGEELKKMLRFYTLFIDLYEPVIIGKAKWCDAVDISEMESTGRYRVWTDKENFHHFSATVHALRMTDMSMECILHRSTFKNCERGGLFVHPNVSEASLRGCPRYDLTRERRASHRLVVQQSQDSANILKKLLHSSRMEYPKNFAIKLKIGYQVDVIDGDMFALTGFQLFCF